MIVEVYVPRKALFHFLEKVRPILMGNHIPLVYGTVRFIEQDKDSFLAWAKRENEDVRGRVAMPKLPERHIPVLTREEIDRIETAAGNERDKLIVRTLADTAIRAHDLDEAKAAEALQRAEDARRNAKDKQEIAAVESEVSMLAAQLAAIRKLRKR